jgi:hypothetical protein
MFLDISWALLLLWHFDGSISLVRDSKSGGQTNATSNKSRRLLVDALGQYPAFVDDATETVVEGTVYDVERKKAF